MTHLGVRVAALVDGELDHEARDRALTHLASCPQCRAEVAAQRALKQEMLGLHTPNPPTPLTARLLSVPVSVPAQPKDQQAASNPRTRYVTFGVAASVVGILGGAFALGGSPNDGPTVRPPVERFTMQHAAIVGDMPFSPPQLGGIETALYLQP